MWSIFLISVLWTLWLVDGTTGDGDKEVWHVSAPNNSTDFKKLLEPFNPIHHAWGRDSLGFSGKHGDSLSVHYKKGSYSKTKFKGGAFYATPTQLRDDVDDLILKYDVYFDNFAWGNMGKLPGLFGGENGKGAYKCSGGSNPSTCFSLRCAWRQHGAGEVYAYIAKDQLAGFDQRDDIVTNYKYGHSVGRGKIHFKTEQWQTIEEHVHLNSDAGIGDGWIKMCVRYEDGTKECYKAENLIIRKSNDHHLRGLVFSSFFGGSRPKDAAPNDCHTYYKNFRLYYPSSDTVIG